jgi:hypothetical protein
MTARVLPQPTASSVNARQARGPAAMQAGGFLVDQSAAAGWSIGFGR